MRGDSAVAEIPYLALVSFAAVIIRSEFLID